MGKRLGYFAPIAALYAVFLGVPLWTVLAEAIGRSGFSQSFGTTVYRTVLWRTIEISAITTICCVVLGFPLAYAIWRSSSVVRAVLTVAVLFPYWTSVVVRAYGWQVLLQRDGPVPRLLDALGLLSGDAILSKSRFGLYLGLIQILLPYMVLPTLAVLSRIDTTLLDAAQATGAGKVRAIQTVVFPLALPGVTTGSLIVFGISAGSFVIPALLGGLGDTMLAQIIARQTSQYLNWPVGMGLSIVLIAVSGAVLIAVSVTSQRLDRSVERRSV